MPYICPDPPRSYVVLASEIEFCIPMNFMTAKNVLTFSALAALAAGSLTILLAGCGATAAPPPPPPPTVTVAPVEQKELVEWDEFTGRTEAVESVEVRPRVSGYIQEVRFQSGQLVEKGDVLFVIDPRWHQAAFNNLEAEADRAKRYELENAGAEANRASSTSWPTKPFPRGIRRARGPLSGSQSRAAGRASHARLGQTGLGLHAGLRAD